MSDEKIREEFERLVELCADNSMNLEMRQATYAYFIHGKNYSDSQSAERIKELEQQVAMLLDVLTNEEGSHSDFQDAVNRTTQTAEAYKRRVQAEALDAAILRLDMTDWPPTKSSAQILRRMASELLKEGE